jgi:hypothetical protein
VRAWAFVWETVYLGVHEQNEAELFASHALPPSLPLSLSCARIYLDSSLPPRRKLVHQPGSAWLKQGRPHRGRRIFCAATDRGGGARCCADRGGAHDDGQEAALGACRAGQEERDRRLPLPRSSRLSLQYSTKYLTSVLMADGAEAYAGSCAQTDPRESWAQKRILQRTIQCIWILQTDPPAQPEFGSCRRRPPEQDLDPPEHGMIDVDC